MIQVGSSSVLHRSMMAHTKVRIQRYVSLKKNSHCWSFHSTKVMLFVQVRTERSIEFYQIMLLNIEYDMSLSRPHSKLMLFFTKATSSLRNKYLFILFHFFKTQLSTIFSWNCACDHFREIWSLLQTCLRYTYYNDGNQKCRLIMQLLKCISYTNEKNVLCENYIMSWLSKAIIDVKYKVGWMIVEYCYFLQSLLIN